MDLFFIALPYMGRVHARTKENRMKIVDKMEKAHKKLLKTQTEILLAAANEGKDGGGLTTEQIHTHLEELKKATVVFFRELNE